MASFGMAKLARLALLFAAPMLWLAAAMPAVAQQEWGDRVCYQTEAEWSAAASINGASLQSLDWEPFGREVGWETYLPLIQQEIASPCPADTPDFAAHLAAFQAQYALPADGVFGAASFQVMKGLWQERRPFVMVRVAGGCPHYPERYQLAEFDRTEETARRAGRMAHAEVIEAYRRMVADARAALPEIRDDPDMLTVFSTYRHPDIDGVRCEDQANCDGLRRASCSAHRTGYALDIMVGQADGYGVDSTNAYNRLVQTRGPAYRWLVANAGRYGFANYVYEPWHWEYIGPGADYSP